MAKKAPVRKFFFSLIAFFLATAAALVGAEFVVRYAGIAPGLNRVSTKIHRLANDPALKYELIPYSYNGYEAVNGEGRRDFHYPKKKTNDTYRIALLGDSVAFGWGNNVWDTHPNAMEYYLNHYKRGTSLDFQVWNFGVRGYGTEEELACLEQKVLPTEPDQVILSYNLNDPDPFSVDLAWAYSAMDWADEQYLSEMKNARRSWKMLLYRESHLYRLLRYRALAEIQKRDRKKAINQAGKDLVKLEKQHNYKDAKHRYFREIHDAYFDRVKPKLKRFADICKGNGIVPVLAIFPGLDDLGVYHYGSIHRDVQKAAQEAGFRVIDLLPVFATAHTLWPDEKLSHDFDHPNPLGQHLAGWAIAATMIEKKWLPASTEAFPEKFYSYAVPTEPMDLSYFEGRDMFQTELGLNFLIFKDIPSALGCFEKALAINPKNKLVRHKLQEMLESVDDLETRTKILALLR